MCVTNHHDMTLAIEVALNTLAIEVALNPNTTNQSMEQLYWIRQ